MKLIANGVTLEVVDSGADPARPQQPVVLLVMGLGMQLVAWPQPFVDALVQAGCRVLRFDNRDIGLSQHFDALGVPNLAWEGLKHRVGLPVRAPYSLDDMAADALGLLDALGVARAHVVGVSMGGMVAQRLALAAPHRVASLASIMSSSGARHLPGPRPDVLKALLGRPRQPDEDGLVEHAMGVFRVIGSPGFAHDEAQLRGQVRLAMRRSWHPAGVLRQLAAIAADTRRADELPRIKAPTLVVHGKADPLVPHACGEDTARRIRSARLVTVEGMGHDLPPGVVKRILDPLLPHLQAASLA